MQFIGSYIDFLEQTDSIVMSVFYQLVVALWYEGISQTALQEWNLTQVILVIHIVFFQHVPEDKNARSLL